MSNYDDIVCYKQKRPDGIPAKRHLCVQIHVRAFASVYLHHYRAIILLIVYDPRKTHGIM